MNPIKPTSLEGSDDVVGTLNWKVKALEDEGAVIEPRLADYITRAVIDLEGKKEYIEEVTKQIAAEKKVIEKQIKKIKADGAVFFAENGLEKIEGALCKSVFVVAERPSKTTKETKAVFTPLISQAEIEELLLALGKAEMRSITTVKKSNHIPAALRILKPDVVAEIVE